MEYPFAVTLLNDFIFCPASIYFHMVDANVDKLTYESKEQSEGSALHEKVDRGEYSDRTNILQGVSVFCEEYGLEGKIDLFDINRGLLTERKRLIKEIYDGYIFQLYAYYFALTEMGYQVNDLRFYSMLDNKSYSIQLPQNDVEMLTKFKKTVSDLRNFNLSTFEQHNEMKCKKCVYEPLCSFSSLKGGALC